MLSSRLVHKIEDHWEPLASKAIERIRKDKELRHIGSLPASELSDWGQEVLKNLGQWLMSREEDVARHYEATGRTRYRQHVPLHESVRAAHLLEDTMIDYIREHDIGPTTVDLYAEEELEHRVFRFFQVLIYHLVKGYESSLREAAHSAV